MKVTPVKAIPDVPDKRTIEAMRGFIKKVWDVETNDKGKQKQGIILAGADGSECRLSIMESTLFMGSEMEGKQIILTSTSEGGELRGLKKNVWNDKHSVTVWAGTSIQNVDSEQASQPTASSTPRNQSSPPASGKIIPPGAKPGIEEMCKLHRMVMDHLIITHGPIGIEASSLMSLATSICIQFNYRTPEEAKPAPQEIKTDPAPCDPKAIADTIYAAGGCDMEDLRQYDLKQLGDIVSALLAKSVNDIGPWVNKGYDDATLEQGGEGRGWFGRVISTWGRFLKSPYVKNAKSAES